MSEKHTNAVSLNIQTEDKSSKWYRLLCPLWLHSKEVHWCILWMGNSNKVSACVSISRKHVRIEILVTMVTRQLKMSVYHDLTINYVYMYMYHISTQFTRKSIFSSCCSWQTLDMMPILLLEIQAMPQSITDKDYSHQVTCRCSIIQSSNRGPDVLSWPRRISRLRAPIWGVGRAITRPGTSGNTRWTNMAGSRCAH